MNHTVQFHFGDRVVHAGRPEWGPAVVTSAQAVLQDGKPCQRLTLRFDRAGLKTVSTAVADIRPYDETAALEPEAGNTDGSVRPESGWLGSIEQLKSRPEEAFARLPEACTDPFASVPARVGATLNLFRFAPQGGSLLDWAAMQTGLRDPLSQFSRHQLEQYFERFAFERFAHLKRLMKEVREEHAAEVRRIVSQAPKPAQDAVRKIDEGR